MVRWLPWFVVALAAGWFVGERQAPGEPPAPRGPAIERALTPEQKIEKALDEPTNLEFVETPFGQVMDYISETHGIKVQIDKKVQDELFGISSDNPVTEHLSNVSLRSALKLTLEEFDLTWVIKDEVLFITTQEAGRAALTVETYDVTDLAANRDEKGDTWYDGEPLRKVLAATVASTTWDGVNGPGSCAPLVVGQTAVLVVNQTKPVHEQIANVLAKLRKHGDKQTPRQGPRPEPAAESVKPPRSGSSCGPVSERIRTAEKRIEKALQEPTKLEFIETPLCQVVDYICDMQRINIQLDKKIYEEIGVMSDTPITKNLEGISLRSALNLTLEELGLAWVIKDEVLFITTKKKADHTLTVETYDITDLATYRDEKDEIRYDGEPLGKILSATVAPTTWDRQKGPGSCAPFVVGQTVVLIVNQTKPVHEEIANVLAKLREQVRKHGDKQLPPRRDRPKAAEKSPSSPCMQPPPAKDAK